MCCATVPLARERAPPPPILISAWRLAGRARHASFAGAYFRFTGGAAARIYAYYFETRSIYRRVADNTTARELRSPTTNTFQP